MSESLVPSQSAGCTITAALSRGGRWSMDDEMLEKITRRLHELARAGLCVSVDEGGISLEELYAIIDEEFGPGTAAAYEAAVPRALHCQ